MGDVDILAVEERRVTIREAGESCPSSPAQRFRVKLLAVAEEMRATSGPVPGREPPVVREAEAALPVADDCRAVERAQLEAVEALQVPVVMRR